MVDNAWLMPAEFCVVFIVLGIWAIAQIFPAEPPIPGPTRGMQIDQHDDSPRHDHHGLATDTNPDPVACRPDLNADQYRPHSLAPDQRP